MGGPLVQLQWHLNVARVKLLVPGPFQAKKNFKATEIDLKWASKIEKIREDESSK